MLNNLFSLAYTDAGGKWGDGEREAQKRNIRRRQRGMRWSDTVYRKERLRRESSKLRPKEREIAERGGVKARSKRQQWR